MKFMVELNLILLLASLCVAQGSGSDFGGNEKSESRAQWRQDASGAYPQQLGGARGDCLKQSRPVGVGSFEYHRQPKAAARCRKYEWRAGSACRIEERQPGRDAHRRRSGRAPPLRTGGFRENDCSDGASGDDAGSYLHAWPRRRTGGERITHWQIAGRASRRSQEFHFAVFTPASRSERRKRKGKDNQPRKQMEIST